MIPGSGFVWSASVRFAKQALMSAVLAVTLLTSLPIPAAAGDAPMKLITEHGVELSADEQVFLLFAALNAAGYAEEPRRKGPPLNAPVFHPIRQDVRDKLRKARDSDSLKGVRKVFEENPQPIRVYVEAALSMAPGAPEARGPAAGLAKSLASLSDFRTDAELEVVFDQIAQEQRKLMKELKVGVEKDFKMASKLLGVDSFRAPVDVTVVPNPLDGHGLVRRLTVGGTTYLVVGPGAEQARAAILEAALEPTVRAMVNKSYDRGPKLARSWSTLKTTKRITRRWPNGPSYLTAALTAALAHRAMAGGKASRDADEEFIDDQAKNGMRWARAALRILDQHGSDSLEVALPRLLAKAAV